MSISRNIAQRYSLVGGQQVDNADITIHSIGQGNIVVPITARSVRRFMLMQDDFIQLEFSLAEAVHFGIGDYIVDDVFGKFVITTEQMPKYNQRTAGYDYTLRFDAPYIGWGNWLFCLVADGKRVESRWNLTAPLATHAQQVADNINVLVPPTITTSTNPETGETTKSSTGYAIMVDVDDAPEIKHLQYEGVNIIEALGMISEAWGCEWWKGSGKVVIDGITYSNIIHFGKCESSAGISGSYIEDGAYVMTLGDNVESMEIARDQQDYCNRLYVYGGTQNIPEDYDRRLEFTAKTTPRLQTFKDEQRALTLDMIDAPSSIPSTSLALGTWSTGGINPKTHTQRTVAQDLQGKQTFVIDLTTELTMWSDDWAATDIPSVMCSATLHYGSSVLYIRTSVQQLAGIGSRRWFADIDLNKEIDLGNSAVSVYLEIVWSVSYVAGSSHTLDEVDKTTDGTITATQDASTATKQVVVVFNGTKTTCTFNGATGNISPKPTGLVNGSKYAIENLDLLKVPLSWYTIDYQTGTIATMGEKRLHLPLDTYPNRYIEQGGTSDATQVVEQAVIFDKIFPRLRLRISSLSSEPMKQKVEHSDGSISYEDWTKWKFKLEYFDPANETWSGFNFKLSYMLDGAKLQAVFSAPADISATGHLLAGMTFDLGYDERDFTIIRNEDYGVLLPNDTLVPSLHDELVLTGWNPRAMNEIGMVVTAETELAVKGQEYLDAITDGQFTITAHMMSRNMMYWPFCDGNDANGRRFYGLLDAGCKVKVNHAALPGGSKTSRVLGYEYKLDMPYDTPTYIIGETDAYSRLKRIEKQLTKL